jgi:hypothetical protein
MGRYHLREHVRSRRLVVVVLIGVACAPAWAQVPAGPEFQVNTTTTAHQFLPSIDVDERGDFVLVWTSVPPDEGNGLGVFAKRYERSGAVLAPEFRVTAHTTGDQLSRSTSVDADARGNFVVAWAGDGAGGTLGTHARRWTAAAQPLGPDFAVSTTPGGQDFGLALMRRGGFVVVWQGFAPGQSDYDVFGRRYDTAGEPLGAAFRVNTVTAGNQVAPRVASGGTGSFVVVWAGQAPYGGGYDIRAQKFLETGERFGAEFGVNERTSFDQTEPAVAVVPAGEIFGGSFLVAWTGDGSDGSGKGVFARIFHAALGPITPDFLVNAHTTSDQRRPQVGVDEFGHHVVAWQSDGQDGSGLGIFARRFDVVGMPRGPEFAVNTHTTGAQYHPVVSSDKVGNFVVAWTSLGQDGDSSGVFARRFGGLSPVRLRVDPAPTPSSDGNGVLEPCERVVMAPGWQNASGSTIAFGGSLAEPSALQIVDGIADYGAVPAGSVADCSDCYVVQVECPTPRPQHVDVSVFETIQPAAQGQRLRWFLHVGDSFTDVPRTSPFYRFVETMLHHFVTSGCAEREYCPAASTTREQVAALVLSSKEGSSFFPRACTTPMFGDVPASSPFCRWIEELARRGVVAGCGGGNYCPGEAVTREQMAVFVLRTLDPALDPPACTMPLFDDVPASSPFCRWIEELARRGVVAECGGGNYCPGEIVTREQMAVFLAVAFDLSLYGP